MWFFGKVDLGKSVSSLAGRKLKIANQLASLNVDIAEAIETRTTVIATIGEEIKQLQALT